ncbi:Anthocyanin 5-aromatic acyltransferase [Ananas comosus]|uniref:Anthocyanin 5-aromatic acyltransferase n=1 Tax=Ananas comosus TaxID=4615 RepID=A0A199URE9_ANACO|nr:Anthocyanin 5-aromatic acyltransferase [Ananas comosus]
MADLVEKDGVLAAAMAIGRAIKGLENGVLEGAEGWMQKILSILPEGPMFQVYGTDFGWGRPKKKTPGTVSLAESSDEQGGVEIGLVLPKDEMDAFQSCFYDELKLF